MLKTGQQEREFIIHLLFRTPGMIIHFKIGD
ncbi:MAG: hypothetical protein ACI90V_009638, partial [Bacillariaceae sp.]